MYAQRRQQRKDKGWGGQRGEGNWQGEMVVVHKEVFGDFGLSEISK